MISYNSGLEHEPRDGFCTELAGYYWRVVPSVVDGAGLEKPAGWWSVFSPQTQRNAVTLKSCGGLGLVRKEG